MGARPINQEKTHNKNKQVYVKNRKSRKKVLQVDNTEIY